MKKAKFVDRRTFERIPVNLPLKFSVPGLHKEGLVQTRDISAKGIGLLTDEELRPNTPLEMWLQIPDNGEPLYAAGKVAWSERLESDKYREGISLEKADLMGMSRVLRINRA